MSAAEKFFSILAICYITGLVLVLFLVPAARGLWYLLPLSLIGVGLNVGLLFVVFKDILNRSFATTRTEYFWLVIVFLFIPAILIYLPKYGFKKR